MILKSVLFVFLYLLCGIGTLELILFHDRKCDDSFDQWGIGDCDDIEQVIIVILFPLFLALIIFWAIGKGLALIIKGIRILITTVIYSIVAIIKEDKKE